jgi:ketosteroid isomerase-like protein
LLKDAALTSDAAEVIATIERTFRAIGDADPGALCDLVCDGFHAFENGVPMPGHELLAAMRRYHAQGTTYRWSVTSPQVDVAGDLAVAVYVNKGSIREAPDVDPVPMSWLETVVLRRQQSRWRIAFVHSTRTPAAL